MKQVYSKILAASMAATLLMFLSLPNAIGQTGTGPWDLLSDLLNQMGDDTNETFLENFDDLSNDWNVDLNGNNDVYNELFNSIGDGSVPTLDDSYLDVWGPGFGLLSGSLAGSGISNGTQDSILDTYLNVNDIFNSNSDSLGGAFGQYQDSLQFFGDNWNVVVIGSDDLIDDQFNELSNTFDATFDPDNPGDFSDVLAGLFSPDIFPDLELAFGTQNASLSYHSLDYEARAKVIRVGSVPRFDQDNTICQTCPGIVDLPVEARWHVQGSFLSKEDINGQGDADLGAILDDVDGFSPLLFSGDFALMAMQNVGTLGNTNFRFITSLGVEAATYAPSHREFNDYTRRRANQGFATGYGPQFGAGVSITSGDLTIYSLATVAKGEALRCAAPYEYDSRRFEAGIRYGNVVNVRYSTGEASWQPDSDRTAKVGHQITVGIILSELNL